MRVGVYIDGYNLYYGARAHCGRGRPGWRWLDVRSLVDELIGLRWPGEAATRIVYCTAPVSRAENPSASDDQKAYIEALTVNGSVDIVEQGRYVAWPKDLPLATVDAKGRAQVIRPDGSERWDRKLPIMRGTDALGQPLLLAKVRAREEKGSDVNVAARLLHDVLTGNVEAAVVVSNDSDLGLAVKMARERVPVGVINPQKKYLAGALSGKVYDGAGNHWWSKLEPSHFTRHQLPNPVGGMHRPSGW